MSSTGLLSVNASASYELKEKSEAFYTGGDVQFTSDGLRVLAACASAVKVLRADTGRVEKSIEEASRVVLLGMCWSCDCHMTCSGGGPGDEFCCEW